VNDSDGDISVQIEELIGRIALQESLYREINALSNAQLAELDTDNDVELASFTDKKNALLARIEQLDAETCSSYERCKPLLSRVSHEQQFRLQVARLRASEALREAVATEQAGKIKVKERLEQIRGEIEKVNQARRVAATYRPKLRGEDEPKFLDEKL